ncbi:MAG: DUF427 domain-containing protein [Bacteroidota bacterium]
MADSMKGLGGRNLPPYWDRFDRLQRTAGQLLGARAAPRGVFRFATHAEADAWNQTHRRPPPPAPPSVMTRRIEPGPGQESVWDYPRPPALEPVAERVRVEFGGETIADTTRALRILETSHPPTLYLPPDDIRLEFLTRTARTSGCEFKGRAVYFDVEVNGQRAAAAAWSYPEPAPRYADLKDHLAFYPSRMDACWIGDERVQAQEGDFYGGWITSKVVGPFKGAPGTWGW